MPYDGAKYGPAPRKWFGLTRKWGGDLPNEGGRGTSAYTMPATNGATAVSHLAKWYPDGPIKILKCGARVLATLTNASSDKHLAKFLTRGASASVACTVNLKSTSTAIAPAAVASKAVMTISQVKAGEYLAIRTATPLTDKGTAIAATTTGSVAFFVDYIPAYDVDYYGLDTKTP